MLTAKIISSLLVLIAAVGGGAFSKRFLEGQSARHAGALAKTFAGGVFLGAAFLHMLPDAIDNFNTSYNNVAYPLFALATSVGFLLILLLDKVIGPAFSGKSENNSIYPYILMMTLSIHSIITGVALGLETHFISAGAILFAILAHKSTAAIALSVSFNSEEIPPGRSRNLQWMFYVTTPIGILLGSWWGVLLEGTGAIKLEGIFDALAAGTFFYIAVMDILAEEFFEKTDRWSRYAMTLLGFLIMAIVAIWT